MSDSPYRRTTPQLIRSGDNCGATKKSRPFPGGDFGSKELRLLDGSVDAIAGLVLRRLDVELMLLGGGGEEAPHAVCLPLGCFHGIDKQMHLGRRVSRYVSA